jgi:DNA-binding transcriptional ArsR family regulator
MASQRGCPADVAAPPALPVSQPESPNRLLHALAHPLRDHLLEVLTVDGASSVAHLAKALGRSPTTVRRHLRVLEAAGAVERVPSPASAGRRGATFRATARFFVSDEEWAHVPVKLRRTLYREVLTRIGGHVRSAIAGDGFDRPDAHVSWVPMSLDETAHAELTSRVAELLQQTLALQVESDQRRPRPRGAARPDELKTEVVLLHFLRESAPDNAEQATATAPPVRRMYELAEELADELACVNTDWERVTANVRELSTLVERRGPRVPQFV